ncbi:hypothetical protein U1Q18_036473 [Sarracenia purpurea var. burkii]
MMVHYERPGGELSRERSSPLAQGALSKISFASLKPKNGEFVTLGDNCKGKIIEIGCIGKIRSPSIENSKLGNNTNQFGVLANLDSEQEDNFTLVSKEHAGHLEVGFRACRRELAWYKGSSPISNEVRNKVISLALEKYEEGEAEPEMTKEGDDSDKNNVIVNAKINDIEAESTFVCKDEGSEEFDSENSEGT